MFELSRSIRRFREDPAWEFKEGLAANQTPLERGGYPYSLRDGGGGHDLRVVSGTVAGYPAHLAHALVFAGAGARAFSVAVLELPFTYPDTVVTSQRLAAKWAVRRRPPFRWGGELVDQLPDLQGYPGMRRASAVPEFALALTSPEVLRLTAEADCGWRLAGRQLVGWTDRERPLDEVLTMAGHLTGIVAAFPADAQRWRGWVG
jgi:hypothetical protein